MKKIFLLLSLFFIVQTAFGCDVNLKIKQIHGLQMNEQEVVKASSEFLLNKRYQQVATSADYLVKIVLSKGQGFQTGDDYFARASISVYKNGQMQNYTLGLGKAYDSTSSAYTTDMFKMAIEKGVSHLPECAN